MQNSTADTVLEDGRNLHCKLQCKKNNNNKKTKQLQRLDNLDNQKCPSLEQHMHHMLACFINTQPEKKFFCPWIAIRMVYVAFASCINQSVMEEQIQVMPFYVWYILYKEQMESKF